MLGKIISFEGIDGSGKSTQIKMLQREFEINNVPSCIFREPGGSIVSEKIREILLDKKNIKLNPYSESLLFAAARAQLVSEKIKPAINNGKIVICDRFVDSTIAYQGYGRGLDLISLNYINSFATDGLVPDITFILDLDPSIAVKRLDYSNRDRMESSGIDFFNKIRQGYSIIKRENPGRCIIINANRDKEDIFCEIKRIIMTKLKEVLECI